MLIFNMPVRCFIVLILSGSRPELPVRCQVYAGMLDIRQRLNQVDYPKEWAGAIAELGKSSATANDSLRYLEEYYFQEIPAAICCQGQMCLHEVTDIMRARAGREKALLRIKLAEIPEEYLTPAGDGE